MQNIAYGGGYQAQQYMPQGQGQFHPQMMPHQVQHH